MSTLTKLSGITLPGAGYPTLPNFAAPTFPAGMANLTGLYFLGGKESMSLRNLVTGADELTKTGTPTVNAYGATCSITNCYNTNEGSANDVTIIAIAKPFAGNPANAAASWFLASQYGANPGGDGLSFYSTGLTMWGSTAGGAANSPSLSLAGANAANWNSFAGRVKADGSSQVWWGKDGATVAGAAGGAVARTVQAGRKFALGGHYGANFGATGNLLMAAIFTGAALSDANITDNLAYLRSTVGPQLGITTL